MKKNLKLLTMLGVAAMLFACGGNGENTSSQPSEGTSVNTTENTSVTTTEETTVTTTEEGSVATTEEGSVATTEEGSVVTTEESSVTTENTTTDLTTEESSTLVEPEVVSTTVDALAATAPTTEEIIYEFTGVWVATGNASDKYGNGYIIDPVSGNKLTIYGLAPTKESCLTYSESGYEYTNPKTFQNLATEFESGDKITVAGVYVKSYKNYTCYFVEKVQSKTELTYNVTVECGDNGTAVLSAETGSYGDEVSITVTPNDGYVVDTVKFNGTNVSGNEGVYTANIYVALNEFVVTFRDENAAITSYTLTDTKLYGSSSFNYSATLTTKDVVESDGTVTYAYQGVGAYGDGIQSRYNNTTTGSGLIYNTTAFNQEIASVTIVPNAKWTSATSAMSIAFGTEVISTKPTTYAGTFTNSSLTVDCNVSGAKYLRFDHTVSGAVYIDEIIINFVTE